MDSDKRSTPSGKRIGREALLDAAADLLISPSASDVAGGVVGVRRVAEAAGVAPATVNHHFRPTGGGRNERLVVAAVRHALTRTDLETSHRVAASAADEVEALRAGDDDAVRRLALVAASDILAWTPDTPVHDETPEGRTRRSNNNALYLATVMSTDNTEVREALVDFYADVTSIWSQIYQELLDVTQRRLIGGMTVSDFATILSALADGFLLRRSFDPASARADLFGEAAIRLFGAISSPRSATEDHDPSDVLAPLPPGSQLDGHKRTAIAQAAATVYTSRGWDELTVSAVAARSGVSRRTVVAHFGDRSGLAAAVWSRFIPDLVTALEHDSTGTPLRSVIRHLERVAAIARSHRPLSIGLLEGMLQHSIHSTRSQASDPTDPEGLAPLGPILQPTIEAAATSFRPGHADSPSNARHTARHLTTITLGLACERPSMTDSGIASYVADTTLAGMLTRRHPRSS